MQIMGRGDPIAHFTFLGVDNDVVNGAAGTKSDSSEKKASIGFHVFLGREKRSVID
jgi:hypothetical protein